MVPAAAAAWLGHLRVTALVKRCPEMLPKLLPLRAFSESKDNSSVLMLSPLRALETRRACTNTNELRIGARTLRAGRLGQLLLCPAVHVGEQ